MQRVTVQVAPPTTTTGSLPSITATQLLVVPRSIPIALGIVSLLVRCNYLSHRLQIRPGNQLPEYCVYPDNCQPQFVLSCALVGLVRKIVKGMNAPKFGPEILSGSARDTLLVQVGP